MRNDDHLVPVGKLQIGRVANGPDGSLILTGGCHRGSLTSATPPSSLPHSGLFERHPVRVDLLLPKLLEAIRQVVGQWRLVCVYLDAAANRPALTSPPWITACKRERSSRIEISASTSPSTTRISASFPARACQARARAP